MNLQITFKTPDAGEQEIQDWARARVDKMINDREDPLGQSIDPATLSKIEIQQMLGTEIEEAKKWLSKWIQYGEYVTIEFEMFKTDPHLRPIEPRVV